jgi:hypothetical protein
MLLAVGCTGPRTNNTSPEGSIVVSSAPVPGAPGFSKSDPASVNTTVAFNEAVNDSGQGNTDYSVRLTLLEALRGEAAMDKMRHDVPYYIVSIPAEREFLLVRFKYELVNTNTPGVTRLVNRGPLEVYRNNEANADDNKYVLGPLPDFYGKINRGEAVDGWIAFTIPKDAPGPLIVYGRSNADAGIWFKAI